MGSGFPESSTFKFSDDAWTDVLSRIEGTYSELIGQQEVLEKRNAELEGLHSFLSSVLDHMSDILLVADDQFRLLDCNSAASKHVPGLPQRGQSIETIFASENKDELHRALEQAKLSGTISRLEVRIVSGDGETPFELVVSPRRDERRRFVGVVLIGRSVGELRRAYEDLKSAQSRMLRSEKLASVGRLVAGVAHELNNPISFVYGNAIAMEKYVERLESYFAGVREGKSRDELRQLRQKLKLDRSIENLRVAMEGASEGAERVRDIVAALGRLSAVGVGEKTCADLMSITETAARWVTKSVDRQVATRLRGRASAYCRAEQIQQVMMNLLQNAVDAMDAEQRPEILVTLSETQAGALIEVEDNGCGFTSESASRLFDPFFTTKPVGQGTGLGLSISLKIVEEHGGTLSASNREGGGAIFRVRLPKEDCDA